MFLFNCIAITYLTTSNLLKTLNCLLPENSFYKHIHLKNNGQKKKNKNKRMNVAVTFHLLGRILIIV